MKEVEMIVPYPKKDECWMLWEVFYVWEHHSHYYWDNESLSDILESYIMQFTWLLDKKWNEIFESDIIFERWQNREVIFHKWCFCVRHFEVEDYPLDRDTYHIFSHEHIEVIWNIYENPELLTK